MHYAESQRWKVELVECEEIGIGGMKNVTFMIDGKGAYSKMKYESGVHRVQRVPETESGGRIHTSTITVAVMPEAEDVDIQIDEKDIRIDVMRASGNGGQCVNTTDSAVTDHRIGLTLYKLDKIMNGDIQEIIDACIAADQAAKLANMNEEM